jgi:hypothetical protein
LSGQPGISSYQQPGQESSCFWILTLQLFDTSLLTLFGIKNISVFPADKAVNFVLLECEFYVNLAWQKFDAVITVH